MKNIWKRVKAFYQWWYGWALNNNPDVNFARVLLTFFIFCVVAALLTNIINSI